VIARTTNHEPRTTNHEPRTTNHEPRTTNHEPRTTNKEQRTKNKEPRTDSCPLGELLSYIRAMVYHERSDSEQSKLQEVMENSVQDEVTRQEVTKMWKTGAEALMERGAHQAGLQTRRQTLVRLLRKRFGKVPSAVVSVVEATDDVDQLDNWLDRFATAQTLEELGIGKQV
jgi:hypothetical protein